MSILHRVSCMIALPTYCNYVLIGFGLLIVHGFLNSVQGFIDRGNNWYIKWAYS